MPGFNPCASALCRGRAGRGWRAWARWFGRSAARNRSGWWPPWYCWPRIGNSNALSRDRPDVCLFTPTWHIIRHIFGRPGLCTTWFYTFPLSECTHPGCRAPPALASSSSGQNCIRASAEPRGRCFPPPRPLIRPLHRYLAGATGGLAGTSPRDTLAGSVTGRWQPRYPDRPLTLGPRTRGKAPSSERL